MARKILILGNSGTGKSTSIRTLDPNTTFIIKCIEKDLPFKNSSKLYCTEKKNIYTSSKAQNILGALQKINQNENIKTLVIDDFNYIMSTEFIETINEKGYDKFSRMAKGIHDIIAYIDTMRSDLTVFIFGHTQIDEYGNISLKTIGKLVSEKLNVEGMFTVVLLASGSKSNYNFITNGLEPAKSPIGMFSEPMVENDLQLIENTIKEYI